MGFFSAILWLIVAIICLIFIAEIAMRFAPNYQLVGRLPGPPMISIWSVLNFIYKMTPETTFLLAREWANTYKETYATWALVKINLEVIRAPEMEIILSSSKHTEKGLVYELLRPFMGDGLLTSNGKKWQRRRKILTPTFHFSILQQFLAVFKDEGLKLVKMLEKDSTNNEPTTLAGIASRFTLNTISETSMGVKLDALEEADEYRKKVYDIGGLLLDRFLKPWLHDQKMYHYSLLRLNMDKILEPVHNFTRNVIKKRRANNAQENLSLTRNGDGGGGAAEIDDDDNIYESKKRRYAMLDTLLSAEKNGEIDAEGIREEVDTFMFEGHDTTAAGLVFIFFLLGQHKEVQQRVYEEIQEIVTEAAGKSLGTTDFNDMVYTDRVIKETMRLYPPVPFISRDLTEDIRISSGKRIPKGVECHLHIYDLHRDPEQFPDPEKFDPDRFLPEECEKRHPFAYLPFSAGPRNCIGQKYAMLEMKSCLTDIIMNYTIEPVTKLEDIVFIVDIVLRTKTPVKVQFVKRK